MEEEMIAGGGHFTTWGAFFNDIAWIIFVVAVARFLLGQGIRWKKYR